jgi:hypothetical protein
MRKFLKYTFKKYNKTEYNKFLSTLATQKIDGVIINALNHEAKFIQDNFLQEVQSSINEMVIMAHERDILTAVELDLFNSRYLWQHKNFTPPVSSHGAEYCVKHDYYPICPNNKLTIDRFSILIDFISNIIPDYFILSEFRFPYDWRHHSLDLPDKIPPYCYCPFCIGEFSSELGIVVTGLETLYANINEWMNWRFEVLDDYFEYLLDKLVPKRSVIIQVPPLNLVDIPFSTGQVLLDYAEQGAKISPLLFHRTKNKEANWALEILDVLKIDIPAEIILPAIEMTDKNNPGNTFSVYDDYDAVFIY